MAARSAPLTVARSRRLDCMRGRRRSTNRCLRRMPSSTSTRSSTAKGGGSARLRTVTVQSPSSTSPVGRSGLTVPSGRGRTVPSTASTYSLRTSTVPGITHWTMPEWSRRSMKARCSPCSRRLATQPQTVTVVPTSSSRGDPHRRVRIEVASAGRGTVTGGPFGSGTRSRDQGHSRGRPAAHRPTDSRTASTTSGPRHGASGPRPPAGVAGTPYPRPSRPVPR